MRIIVSVWTSKRSYPSTLFRKEHPAGFNSMACFFLNQVLSIRFYQKKLQLC
nr:MAG TPA: hypothetical protein [Caudoviricetes sp.]